MLVGRGFLALSSTNRKVRSCNRSVEMALFSILISWAQAASATFDQTNGYSLIDNPVSRCAQHPAAIKVEPS